MSEKRKHPPWRRVLAGFTVNPKTVCLAMCVATDELKRAKHNYFRLSPVFILDATTQSRKIDFMKARTLHEMYMCLPMSAPCEVGC